jgi:aminomethyltransferase
MAATLRRTPLYERHLALGARLVPFAGYDMPIQYAGVLEEHRAVRTAAGVFDVSHMGQLLVGGAAAHAFLQRMLSNDLDRIGPYQAQYTLLTNASGGIVDDLIAYALPDGGYLLVVNAANVAADHAHLREHAGDDVELVDASDENAMVALQGPEAFAVLARAFAPGDGPGAVGDPAAMPSFTWGWLSVAGARCRVARTGYTGEPGVELLCAPRDAGAVWDALLAAGAAPCGLGARDTLRLEVCYPLHGNDIGPATNAIEAGLGWVCALERKDFLGADVLRRTREQGPARRLAAFRMLERGAIPRAHQRILDADGADVGEVTSGTHSPSLGIGIGMGYVPAPLAAPGSAVAIDVRGRTRAAETARKPLYAKEP